ncbi:MAG: hypothetical protein J0L67_04635 [Cytophagales bacterium]|nr:hypothetical protein [Cytophagales bacterium]
MKKTTSILICSFFLLISCVQDELTTKSNLIDETKIYLNKMNIGYVELDQPLRVLGNTDELRQFVKAILIESSKIENLSFRQDMEKIFLNNKFKLPPDFLNFQKESAAAKSCTNYWHIIEWSDGSSSLFNCDDCSGAWNCHTLWTCMPNQACVAYQ